MNVLGLDFQFLLHNKMKKNVNKQKIIIIKMLNECNVVHIIDLV